ncbi:Extracellular solute-binding protein, family 7 [Desulfonatronospira thiodismutans ASO3-1]|uniref:Extracellular solute-binding protein, family 7 n=1 Tax=Desulfonatronospira thiodismutans ASO3-1 TaxID=555779 RepID=D6SS58_9BACT|nr:TRAP transporter substrate-binding protein [Desulfonatronospira thiodismutans]EFI33524.1 Extracellular solute-binding protein, family 7 [Desulfonatronospira thiodismutans ASO3-1]
MKTKSAFFSSLFILACVSLMFACSAENGQDVGEAPHEPIELSMVTFWPASHPQVEKGHNSWIEEVETRTQGRVKINLHAGESLLGAREIFSGVEDGVADIGSTCPAYTPGMFPLTEVFELPGYRNANSIAASLTVHEGYKKFKEDLEVDEFSSVKVLMFWATGPGDIMSKIPVETLEDMQRLEMRAAGGSAVPVKTLGAVPHSMPMSEAYLALDQGLVNSILGPTDTMKGFRLAEVVQYVTRTPFLYNIPFVKVMNQDAWNSLPEDVQDIFEELNEEFVIKYGQIFADASREGLQFARDEHGIEVIELSGEEEDRWIERLDMVVDDWIEEKKARGLPAEEAVSITRELDEKFSSEYGDY